MTEDLPSLVTLWILAAESVATSAATGRHREPAWFADGFPGAALLDEPTELDLLNIATDRLHVALRRELPGFDQAERLLDFNQAANQDPPPEDLGQRYWRMRYLVVAELEARGLVHRLFPVVQGGVEQPAPGPKPQPCSEPTEEELAFQLATEGHRREADLVRHMIGRLEAEIEDVKDAVHGDETVENESVARNASRTTNQVQAVGSSIEYKRRGRFIVKLAPLQPEP